MLLCCRVSLPPSWAARATTASTYAPSSSWHAVNKQHSTRQQRSIHALYTAPSLHSSRTPTALISRMQLLADCSPLPLLPPLTRCAMWSAAVCVRCVWRVRQLGEGVAAHEGDQVPGVQERDGLVRGEGRQASQSAGHGCGGSGLAAHGHVPEEKVQELRRVRQRLRREDPGHTERSQPQRHQDQGSVRSASSSTATNINRRAATQ